MFAPLLPEEFAAHASRSLSIFSGGNPPNTHMPHLAIFSALRLFLVRQNKVKCLASVLQGASIQVKTDKHDPREQVQLYFLWNQKPIWEIQASIFRLLSHWGREWGKANLKFHKTLLPYWSPFSRFSIYLAIEIIWWYSRVLHSWSWQFLLIFVVFLGERQTIGALYSPIFTELG